MLRTALAFAAFSLFLAACSHVPVSSLVAMSRIRFETTDLAVFRAALRMPVGYRARETRMIVEVVQEGQAPLREDFPLERLTAAAELSQLDAEKRAGAELLAYRLPETAVRTFEALRAEALKARAEKRRGSLTIRLEPDFCYIDAPPRGNLLFSTYLRTSETRGYVPVLLDLDAFSQKEHAAKVAAMPKC